MEVDEAINGFMQKKEDSKLRDILEKIFHTFNKLSVRSVCTMFLITRKASASTICIKRTKEVG